MKTRFLIALATILVSAFAAEAATVDEIIAQFPAQDAATANSLFEQLLAMDDDAIEGLCTRLVPLGAGDDNAVRYALTGLARYVSGPGVEAGREVVEEALLEGLEANTDAECRAFLLRQLQQCGTDESVKSVARLLKDEANASHAILVLDTLGTEKANRALTKGLRTKSSVTQLQILSALANNGENPKAAKAARKRLAANPAADEQVHLLSILVRLEGKGAEEDVARALKSDQPRVAQAAAGFAKEIGIAAE
ncbi:MAG: HEAT repeat domain-containing protein [Candidatus Hydrogenedentes bacterium]|nr:HEAT repeat domain-containing protein [Candidatus Hydrogenedentota bacterium]